MLPTKEAMWKDVRTQQNNIRKRYTDSPRNIIMVDYLGYMDELAKLTGNYPHLGIVYDLCSYLIMDGNQLFSQSSTFVLNKRNYSTLTK